MQHTDVEALSQLPDYPTGCESACAVMLLRYYGVDISLSEFVDKYLPMQSVFEKRGKRYAPDPSRFYAGDPASKTRGWGCFPPVIKRALVAAFADKSGGWYDTEELDEVVMKKDDRVFQYYVVDCSGAELFRYEHLPMIIWVTQDYEPVSEVYEWQQFGGNKTFTYPKGSHTVLLTGYDEKYYYINDPLKADRSVKVKKKKLEECFMSVGCQAVSIFGNEVTEYLNLDAYINANSNMQKYGEENKG